MTGIARLLAALTRRTGDRVDGVTAASWENGYYTRNRTDLPYPSRARW